MYHTLRDHRSQNVKYFSDTTLFLLMVPLEFWTCCNFFIGLYRLWKILVFLLNSHLSLDALWLHIGNRRRSRGDRLPHIFFSKPAKSSLEMMKNRSLSILLHYHFLQQLDWMMGSWKVVLTLEFVNEILWCDPLCK